MSKQNLIIFGFWSRAWWFTGRVLRYNHMESSICVGYYSTKEYPQRDFAVKCGIQRFLALPVFERSGQLLVYLSSLTTENPNFFPLYQLARNVLEVVGSFFFF